MHSGVLYQGQQHSGRLQQWTAGCPEPGYDPSVRSGRGSGPRDWGNRHLLTGKRERDRDRDRQRQTDRDRDRDRQTETERD